ncbi:glycosyltransferase family 4 protein [Dokdonia ponticola]|uniref:Glycosyltransferase family 4 protein n=1 Tax=Dokdonia ponticola TaxID=2041041 RepID=A0ABV9I2E9_9FLAO
MKPCVFLAFSISKSSVSDYFTTLAIEMSEKYNVVIFTDTQERIERKNISTYIWPSLRPTGIKDFLFLRSKIKAHHPTLMISVFGAVNMFLIGGYVYRVPKRIAWRRTLTGQLNPSKKSIRRKGLIYKLATTIFVNSNATKEDTITYFKVPEDKITVIYNAVKDHKIAARKREPYRLVYAGRLHPSKGIDTLLEAIQILKTDIEEIELLVLGGSLQGNVIKKYQKQTEDLQIEKQVRFLGNQSKEKLLELFASTQFVVVPSVLEAFGFVVIESFSVKTPVIGSNTSGIAEIIRDGKDGLLFEPSNADDLAKKIKYLFEHPDKVTVFSQNCYQRFLDTFEVNTSVKEALIIVERL